MTKKKMTKAEIQNGMTPFDKWSQTVTALGFACEKRIETFKQPLNAIEKIESIATDEEFASASVALVSAKNLLDAVQADRKEITVKLDNAKKHVMGKYNPALIHPLRERIEKLNELMGGFSAEKRRKAEAKAEKIAKKAEKRGEDAYAHDIREQAQNVKVTPAHAATKEKRIWSARITDLRELLLAILEGKAPSPPKDVELAFQKWLTKLAKVQKSQTNIPGVDFVYISTFGRKGK